MSGALNTELASEQMQRARFVSQSTDPINLPLLAEALSDGSRMDRSQNGGEFLRSISALEALDVQSSAPPFPPGDISENSTGDETSVVTVWPGSASCCFHSTRYFQDGT